MSTAVPRPQPTRAWLPAEGVVILAGVTAALHVGKLPPALPLLRETLGVTLLQAGFLLSLVQLAGMTLGLLVGMAADGLGLRRSLLAGLLILAAASALGGLATAPGPLLLLRAVEGAGLLLATLPAPSLIRRLVPGEHLSRRLGLWGAYMPTGSALALLLGPWVLAGLPWPAWWWGLALLTAAMAVWVARAVPPDPRRPRAGAAPAAAASAGAVLPCAPAAPAVPGWSDRLRRTLGARGPWLVALAFAAYSSQWLAVIGFLPTLYAQAGLAGPLAGALTALASAANIVGNVGAGRLLWRGWSAPRLLAIGYATMAVGALLAFALPADAGAWAAPLRYAAVLLFSAVGGLIPGALFSLAVRLAPGEHSVSTTVGWVQQCSSLGQFAGPPLVAAVASAVGGWQWTWGVTGSASLLGLGLAAAIAGELRRSVR
ncbi:MAG: MFS transporter [Burkholderiaceae bacterium]|nr:MFS transporter [Burkholderiaceae bacterium]